MNRTNFNILVEQAIDEIRHRLLHKGKEYANNDNVFANFDKAAIKKNTTPLLALEGMLAKHQVSIDDIVYGVVPYSKDMVMEKYLDEICYRILQMGLLERENSSAEKEMEENPAVLEATVTEETKTLYIKTIDGTRRVLTGNHTPVHGDLYIDDKENVFDIYPDEDGWYMRLESIGTESPTNSMVVVKLDDFRCRDKAKAHFEGNTRYFANLYHDKTFFNEESNERIIDIKRLTHDGNFYLGWRGSYWEAYVVTPTFPLKENDVLSSKDSDVELIIRGIYPCKEENTVIIQFSLASMSNDDYIIPPAFLNSVWYVNNPEYSIA